MVRHMLGAVNEFVAASARERLKHGRAKALEAIAQDPRGARSYHGKPKLGARQQFLEQDNKLYKKMEAYADMPEKARPSLNQIAKDLRKVNKKWAVRTGKNKGKPWAAKQIHMFLHRFGVTVGARPGEQAKPTRTPATPPTKTRMAATAHVEDQDETKNPVGKKKLGRTPRLVPMMPIKNKLVKNKLVKNKLGRTPWLERTFSSRAW